MVEAILIPRRALVMLALAVAHLVGVSLGTQGRLPDVSPLGRAFAQYAAFTGADSSYSFFAPNVGTQLRMIFEVTDRAGPRRRQSREGLASARR